MALKIWLPLNGNLDNLGTEGPIIFNTTGSPTINNNGKIGKCYSFDGSSYFISQKNDFLTDMTECSFACWIKDTYTANAYMRVFGIGTHKRVHLDITNAGKLRFFISKNGTNNTFWGPVGTTDLRDSQWHHICGTFNNKESKVYVDGVCEATVATGDLPTVTGGQLEIGHIQDGIKMTGFLNDLRIYDHCLSTLEVKEISQGLILHYKLNGFSGGAGENLLLGSKSFNGWVNQSPSNISINDGIATWHDITSASWKSITYYNYGTWTDLVNKEITFSVDIRTDDINNFPTSGSNIQLTCAVFNGTSRIAYRAFKGIIKTDVSSSWKRISGTCLLNTTNFSQGTIENTYTVGAQIFNNTIASFQVKNPKIEIGNTATSYSLASADLGIDTTKIIDSSGYDNNGIAVNSPIPISDSSSKYGLCTQFNGSNTYINAGIGAKVKDEITIAWWGYMDTWSSYARAISCTEGGGWNFEPASGNKINFAMGTGTSSNTYKSCTSNTTLASLASGWHHFVGTYDGLESNFYIDGVLDKTLSCYTTKTPIYYHPSNSIIVGAEANAGNTAAGSYFNGKLSDIRIYATALSAEDIATLYHIPAQIDNLGSVHCFEVNEMETTNLSDFTLTASNWVSDGVTATYNEGDMGPMVKIVPSSGSKRIYHNVTNVWKNEQSYIVSFIAKADANGAILRASRSIANFAPNFNLTTSWQKYYGIITSSTTTDGGTLSIDCQTSTNYYIADIKLEEANKNLISILENGVVKENWIDENNFNNNAKFLKETSVIIGNNFIEK